VNLPMLTLVAIQRRALYSVSADRVRRKLFLIQALSFLLLKFNSKQMETTL